MLEQFAGIFLQMCDFSAKQQHLQNRTHSFFLSEKHLTDDVSCLTRSSVTLSLPRSLSTFSP